MSTDVILIIDDEPDLVELLSYNLAKEGFRTIAEQDGPSGLGTARQKHPQLILLDLMLPGLDGLEVCRSLRRDPQTKLIPIIMLTAKSAETDRVVGLELGADDYVTKPFSTRELVARIRALLRRGDLMAQPRELLRHGPLCIDVGRYQASYDGKAMPLTIAEFGILRFLLQHPDQVFSRDQIIERALRKDGFLTDRNVDVHIASLRKKLGAGRDCLKTVRGIGYSFRTADFADN